MEMKEELKANAKPETTVPFTEIEGDDGGQKTDTLDSMIPPSTIDTTKKEAPKTPEVEYLTGFKLVILLGSLAMACSLMLLDTSVVVTAIPKITDQFHSTKDIGWYGSAYLLTSCSLQPLTGKLYQNFSLNYTFIFFIGLFELGSLICGVAVSSNMLIVGRAVSGMGGSGIVNGALTILSTAVPTHKRPVTMGILLGVANIANALGPLIGGALTQYATWRWCFFINLPCGAVVVSVILACKIPESRTASTKEDKLLIIIKKLDLLGFTVFAPAIIMLLLAINWGGTTYPWNSGTEIGLFVGAGVMFCIFLGWEHHVGASALIPLAMFKNKIIVFACTAQYFAMSAMIITIYYIPEWFQAVVGKSPSLSGLFILPLILSQIAAAAVGGALISRVGYYLPFAVTGYAIGAIGTGFITTFLPNTSTGEWIGYQIMTGARGMALQVPIVAVQSQLPKETIPIGMAILVFVQTLGGTMSLSFAQLLFNSTLAKQLLIHAPTVSAEDILNWGATGFRSQVSAQDFPGVLLSYDKAITTTLYLAVGCMCSSFIAAWGLGWKSVKKAKVAIAEA